MVKACSGLLCGYGSGYGSREAAWCCRGCSRDDGMACLSQSVLLRYALGWAQGSSGSSSASEDIYPTVLDMAGVLPTVEPVGALWLTGGCCHMWLQGSLQWEPRSHSFHWPPTTRRSRETMWWPNTILRLDSQRRLDMVASTLTLKDPSCIPEVGDRPSPNPCRRPANAAE